VNYLRKGQDIEPLCSLVALKYQNGPMTDKIPSALEDSNSKVKPLNISMMQFHRK
jgi:hypothetical protein